MLSGVHVKQAAKKKLTLKLTPIFQTCILVLFVSKSTNGYKHSLLNSQQDTVIS